MTAADEIDFDQYFETYKARKMYDSIIKQAVIDKDVDYFESSGFAMLCQLLDYDEELLKNNILHTIKKLEGEKLDIL